MLESEGVSVAGRASEELSYPRLANWSSPSPPGTEGSSKRWAWSALCCSVGCDHGLTALCSLCVWNKIGVLRNFQTVAAAVCASGPSVQEKRVKTGPVASLAWLLEPWVLLEKCWEHLGSGVGVFSLVFLLLSCILWVAELLDQLTPHHPDFLSTNESVPVSRTSGLLLRIPGWLWYRCRQEVYEKLKDERKWFSRKCWWISASVVLGKTLTECWHLTLLNWKRPLCV